jgi:replicative DNA helicase Mcm
MSLVQSGKAGSSRHELIEDLVEFYRDYYRQEIHELAEAYPRDSRSLVIDWSDLYAALPGFARDLRDHPRGMVNGETTSADPLAELHDALYRVELPIDIDLEGDDWPSAHVRVRLPPNARMGVGDIRSQHKGEYVALSGQIERVTESTERITTAVWECQRDGEEMRVPQPKDTTEEPSHCAGSCQGKPTFQINVDKSATVDERRLKLSQPPEESDGNGEDLTVLLQDDLAFLDGDETLMGTAGERVTIHGILKQDKQHLRGRSSKPIVGTYLEGHSIEFESSSADDVNVADHRDEITRHIESGEAFERLAASVAPGIKGGERIQRIKRDIVLYLFGAEPKTTATGRLRGDIHLALIGDPSTGKTQLLDFIETVSPRVERLSGTDSTGVGLTASATQDEFAGGDWVLKPGLLPRASGGHAVVDEIDKMTEGVDKLHEALETQRIHVSKAGMNATLKTETGVAVAANPEEGRFTDFGSFVEEIDLDPALFGRFDIIHTLHDQPDETVDSEVAAANLERWQLGTGDDGGASTAPVPPATFRAWIALADGHEPELTDDAKARLQDFYVDERGKEWDSDNQVIPITARAVTALARLAEAHAKVHLRDEITVTDADAAVAAIKAVMGDVFKNNKGQMDADMLTDATPSTQRERMQAILGALEEADGGLSPGDVADRIGLETQQVADDLDQLSTKGRVFVPEKGVYDAT